VFVRALAVFALGSTPVFPIGKLNQTIHAFARSNNDAAAIATIATIGATVRHVFLAAKRHATVAALACLHFNFCSIDKHFGILLVE
jgi:hypothetical protein